MPVRTAPIPSAARSGALDVRVENDGTVVGQVTKGTRIEVANLSTAVTGFLPASEVVVHAVADDAGNFTIKMPEALSGDVLQVWARTDETTPAHETLQLRVNAANRADDPRAAFVSLRRVRVLPTASGLGIEPRTSLPVTEPGATLRFTNLRTRATHETPTDPLGRFPPFTLDGRAGDEIDIAVSDDIALRAPASVGTITVRPLTVSMPAPAGGFAPMVTIPGRLFLETLGLGKQGSLGNCPVPAGASAIAAVDEGAIRDLILDRGDGTYLVTFHPPNQESVEVLIDEKLYGSGRTPRYGTGASDGAGIELWFPLVEKAYAVHVGGYEVLGRGTNVGRVLQDFLGRDNRAIVLKDAAVDDIWKVMKRARANGLVLALGTYPTRESARYTGTGLYPNHAYSILKIEEHDDGRRLVTLRNPWAGAAGFSGVFQLPVADVVALFEALHVC